MLLHTLGKVPGSRGCLWGACDAQARPCASAYRVTTANCSGTTQSAGRPPPGCGREGAHVRTHARTHARTPWPWRLSFPCYQTRGHVGPSRAAGAGSRARASRGVREPAPPLAVRGLGARPSCTEESACRRGGIWVSDAAQPLWAAPVSVPPAASRPGRRPAAAPVAGQMQVAGERGVFGPIEMSGRAQEENTSASERWANNTQNHPLLLLGAAAGA